MLIPDAFKRGCRCKPKDKSNWRVDVYRGNYSAFSGYRFTPSDYSQVSCTECGAVWRTKAKYVEDLK